MPWALFARSSFARLIREDYNAFPKFSMVAICG